MTATNKHIPGKRIKTWHRHHLEGLGTLSLRAFARLCVASPATEITAKAWANGKVAP